jgi:hypothetical protein
VSRARAQRTDSRSCEPVLAKGALERTLVDDSASSRVDEIGAGLQEGELLLVDEIACRGKQRAVEREDVKRREKRLKRIVSDVGDVGPA